jgi:hypothetical protein
MAKQKGELFPEIVLPPPNLEKSQSMHKVPVEHLHELAEKADQLNERLIPPEFIDLFSLLTKSESADFYWGFISGMDLLSQVLGLEGADLATTSLLSAKVAKYWEQKRVEADTVSENETTQATIA